VTLGHACEEYRELKERLDAAKQEYIEGARLLSGSVDGLEFEQAYQIAEHGKLAFVNARENLEKHITDHGCVDFLGPMVPEPATA